MDLMTCKAREDVQSSRNHSRRNHSSYTGYLELDIPVVSLPSVGPRLVPAVCGTRQRYGECVSQLHLQAAVRRGAQGFWRRHAFCPRNRGGGVRPVLLNLQLQIYVVSEWDAYFFQIDHHPLGVNLGAGKDPLDTEGGLWELGLVHRPIAERVALWRSDASGHKV